MDSVHSDSSEQVIDIVPIIIDKDDEEWEIEKEKCSFCRHFLKSPCKLQFKDWSKCVDKCKENETDFIEICQSHTEALITCTSEHPEYFKALDEENAD